MGAAVGSWRVDSRPPPAGYGAELMQHRRQVGPRAPCPAPSTAANDACAYPASRAAGTTTSSARTSKPQSWRAAAGDPRPGSGASDTLLDVDSVDTLGA